MKRVTVVHYSQTGQLIGIAERAPRPLVESADIELTFDCVQPVEFCRYGTKTSLCGGCNCRCLSAGDSGTLCYLPYFLTHYPSDYFR